jgi:hypothetical protein
MKVTNKFSKHIKSITNVISSGGKFGTREGKKS